MCAVVDTSVAQSLDLFVVKYSGDLVVVSVGRYRLGLVNDPVVAQLKYHLLTDLVVGPNKH